MGDGLYFAQSRKEMIKFLYNLDSTKKILDVGAGEGGFINSVYSQFKDIEIWAIEPDVEAAKKIRCNKILNNSIEESIDILPNYYYDYIVLNDVLEHTYSPWDIINQLKIKLKDDGFFIISVPNFQFILTFVNVIFGDFKYEEFGVLDRTHLRFFTKKSLLRFGNELNLKIISIKGINGVYTWKYRLLNFLSFGLLKNWMHQQWAIVLKKN